MPNKKGQKKPVKQTVKREGKVEGKHPGGRPLLFKTVEELQGRINAYFDSCWEEVIVKNQFGSAVLIKDKDGEKVPLKEIVQVRPYTITGLAVALETTRETLLDYEERSEFSYTIKKAKAKIEQYTEEQLFQLRNPAGAIFNLTNNYKRWENKASVKQDVAITDNSNRAELMKRARERVANAKARTDKPRRNKPDK